MQRAGEQAMSRGGKAAAGTDLSGVSCVLALDEVLLGWRDFYTKHSGLLLCTNLKEKCLSESQKQTP